jgi:hypothetical protein
MTLGSGFAFLNTDPDPDPGEPNECGSMRNHVDPDP